VRGCIRGISGATITVDAPGLKLYERVLVGKRMLTGEVVRIEQDRTYVQVYEDTQGLAAGEEVRGLGQPLTVSLGPGLLSSLFDGLQRPLQAMQEHSGPFIMPAGDIRALDRSRTWMFHPMKNRGDSTGPGEAIGYVEEGPLRHFITCPPGSEGKIVQIAGGMVSLEQSAAELDSGSTVPLYRDVPVRVPRARISRHPVSEMLITGQRSIDLLFGIARGGTAIMPGGFGTGKTVLEHAIAKFANVDIVVYVGCGERGNEMAELIEEFRQLSDPWTGRPLMERTILCANTSNMPVAAREASIYTAITMAEYYRDMGYDVLFLADSLSRWAEALREISSCLEELPGEEGYPTYLASRLSAFLERAGVSENSFGEKGSLTMVLSVSPPGGDFTEPVTQACLRSSGVFLMLDTSLAHRRHFPAINWSQSYSLYRVTPGEQKGESAPAAWDSARSRCREILAREEKLREVAEIVGLEGLQDEDRLLMRCAERIRVQFLCQNSYTEDAFSKPDRTLAMVTDILDFYDSALQRLSRGEALEEAMKVK
jgi:V/A-type H+-transporting ATPase subunit A